MKPFEPQPLDQLRQKFKLSITKLYSVEKALQQPETHRPGAQPENIYDFEDGVRLIISREQYQGKEVIHFSGSFSDTALFRDKGRLGQSALMGLMRSCFERLRGQNPENELLPDMEEPDTDHVFIGFSTGGVPHWIVPLANLN